MKRIISLLLLSALTALALVGCGWGMPRPEITEGSFDFSVSYELNGEVKTVTDTYVCNYSGVSFTLEGTAYRYWKGAFEGALKKDDSIKICDTQDGGEIILSFLMYPEYFMGEPDYADFTPSYDLAVYYYDENGYILEDFDDEQTLASHGVRFIGFEYGDPIENLFK